MLMRARSRGQAAGQDFQQGGFSGAVAAGDHQRLAGRERERKPSKIDARRRQARLSASIRKRQFLIRLDASPRESRPLAVIAPQNGSNPCSRVVRNDLYAPLAAPRAKASNPPRALHPHPGTPGAARAYRAFGRTTCSYPQRTRGSGRDALSTASMPARPFRSATRTTPITRSSRPRRTASRASRSCPSA